MILHGASLCQSVTEVWKTEAKPSILTMMRKKQGMRDKEENGMPTERKTISSRSNASLAKYRQGVDWPPRNLERVMKGNTLTIFDVNIYRPQYLLSFTYIHRLLKMYALLQYWLIIIYKYIYITNYSPLFSILN